MTPIFQPGQKVGFIGGGNMAQAIAFPLFSKGILSPTDVIVSAKSQGTLDVWKEKGCEVSLKNETVLQTASIVFWAVKPQVFPVVAASMRTEQLRTGIVLDPNIFHVTMMAGISLEQFASTVGGGGMGAGARRVIRIMPNVGLKVACGVTVYASDVDATEDDKNCLQGLFRPIGLCYEVQESQINAYCGLFGSGIGFMFPILEAMSDGAVKVGIPRAISLEIAAQVMKGAGELYLNSGIHPAALKDTVCSPGGTTIAGVAELEKGGVRASMINAIGAATVRGEELGKAAAAAAKK